VVMPVTASIAPVAFQLSLVPSAGHKEAAFLLACKHSCQRESNLFTDSPSPAMWWRRPGKQNRMLVTASMRSELSSIHR